MSVVGVRGEQLTIQTLHGHLAFYTALKRVAEVETFPLERNVAGPQTGVDSEERGPSRKLVVEPCTVSLCETFGGGDVM